MSHPDISVALSVYDGVDISFLEIALTSILSQTGPSFEICLVLDGIQRDDLRQFLTDQAAQHECINLIDFPENRKLSAAMNAVIKHMNSGLMIRMDADDISMPGRFAAMYQFMMDHPNVDAAGSGSYEFSIGAADQGLQRSYPQTHDEIVQQFNYNNPFCHPSMIFSKRFFDLGLYPLWTLNEDTMLFLNGLAGGAVYANHPAPLYAHRYDLDTGKRRQNWRRSWRVWVDRQRVISRCRGGGRARLYATALLISQTVPGPIYPWVRKRLLKKGRGHETSV